MNLLARILFCTTGLLLLPESRAYENEVYKSGELYHWKIDGKEAGSSPELHTAINSSLARDRTVHVLTGGVLNDSIRIPSWNVKINFHDHTFIRNHHGNGIINGWDGLVIGNLTLVGGSNMGIRSSRASNLTFQNIRIHGGGIGMRIDSHPSRPFTRTVSKLTIHNCQFIHCGGHGLETYGIDGIDLRGIVARNCGECGVLLNMTKNGTIGTVDASGCSFGHGYAGLRFANRCENIMADTLYAERCGRGYFVLSGSRNCTLKKAFIRNCRDQWGKGRGIWMQNVANCVVESGCCDSGVRVSGHGTSAKVKDGDCRGSQSHFPVTVHGDAGFESWSVGLQEGHHPREKLLAQGIETGSISSLRVAPGYRVVIANRNSPPCRTATITRDESNLAGKGWKNSVMALSVQWVGPVVVYTHKDHDGWGVALTDGDYTTEKMLEAGIPNDSISSIKLSPGYRLTAFRDELDSEPSTTFTSDEGDLSKLDWDDAISSFRIERVGE